MDFICLIIGNDDTVLNVQTLQERLLRDVVSDARNTAAAFTQCRGFQLWSGGKLVYAQLSRNGEHWTENPPEIG
jgi:hypothetical protein